MSNKLKFDAKQMKIQYTNLEYGITFQEQPFGAASFLRSFSFSGASRWCRKKALADQLLEGNPGKRKRTVLEFPDATNLAGSRCLRRFGQYYSPAGIFCVLLFVQRHVKMCVQKLQTCYKIKLLITSM